MILTASLVLAVMILPIMTAITREVFLQTAIYCGVPAAIDAFRNAREVFQEMGID